MERQDFLLTVVYSDYEVGNYCYYAAKTAVAEYLQAKRQILDDNGLYLSASLYKYVNGHYGLLVAVKVKD